MEIIKQLRLGESIRVSKSFLQRYLFNVYKYYLVREPYSDFLNEYIQEYGNVFIFDKALDFYLKQSGTPSEVIEHEEYVDLKPVNLGSKISSEPKIT